MYAGADAYDVVATRLNDNKIRAVTGSQSLAPGYENGSPPSAAIVRANKSLLPKLHARSVNGSVARESLNQALFV